MKKNGKKECNVKTTKGQMPRKKGSRMVTKRKGGIECVKKELERKKGRKPERKGKRRIKG